MICDRPDLTSHTGLVSRVATKPDESGLDCQMPEHLNFRLARDTLRLGKHLLTTQVFIASATITYAWS